MKLVPLRGISSILFLFALIVLLALFLLLYLASKQDADAHSSLRYSIGGQVAQEADRLLQATSNIKEPSSRHDNRHFKPQVVLNSDMIDKLSEKLQDMNKSAGIEGQRHQRAQLLANLTYLLEPSTPPLGCANQWGATTSAQRQKPRLLVLINSKWSNFERRKWQRSTWLNRSQLVRLVCEPAASPFGGVEYAFALGSPPDQSQASRSLELEQAQYGDLLLLNQFEHYRLLSYKHLALFRWILERRASRTDQQLILLKCDDDALIDLGQLVSTFEARLAQAAEHQPRAHLAPTPTPAERQNWIMCARFDQDSPVQRQNNKWAVSRQDYPFDTYPAFCSGLAYLAPLNLVRRLYTTALYLAQVEGIVGFKRPLWIDDVFITGILTASLDKQPLIVPLNGHFCYTLSLFKRRLYLNAPCMVSEIPDTYLQESSFNLKGIEASQRAHKE